MGIERVSVGGIECDWMEVYGGKVSFGGGFYQRIDLGGDNNAKGLGKTQFFDFLADLS